MFHRPYHNTFTRGIVEDGSNLIAAQSIKTNSVRLVANETVVVKRDEQALRSEIDQRRAAASVIDEAEKVLKAKEAEILEV